MRTVFVASVAGASAGAAMVLSFLPVVPPLPLGAWLALFAGVFLVFPVSIVSARRSGRARPVWRADAAELARRYWWLGLAGIVTMVAFVTSLPGLQGQPTIVHGAYFLDDHGSLIRVSHDTYIRALAATERWFAGIACALYCLAAAISHAAGHPSSSAAE